MTHSFFQQPERNRRLGRGILVQEDREKVFKRFNPHFPGSHPSLEQASALNVAFVFQKRSMVPGSVPHPLRNGKPSLGFPKT